MFFFFEEVVFFKRFTSKNIFPMSWTRTCILSAQEQEREVADRFPRELARELFYRFGHASAIWGLSSALLPRLNVVSASDSLGAWTEEGLLC